MFQTNVLEKIKKSVQSPPHKSLAFYEIMFKNMVEPERPQMAVLRMRFAYWIIRTTHTHTHTHTHTEFLSLSLSVSNTLLLFHGRIGYENTLQSYVLHKVLVLFHLIQSHGYLH